MTICEPCEGVGSIVGMACPGAQPLMLPCPYCEGTRMQPPWYEAGLALRKVRSDRLITIREASARFAISPVEWSRAERGLVDPAPFVEMLRRAA